MRQDLYTTAVEYIATSGTMEFTSTSPYTGSLAGVVFEQYTQDGSGAITYVTPPSCLFLLSAPF